MQMTNNYVMSRKYVLDGACLQCTLGSAQGKLKVSSQSKLYTQGKKVATDKDKQVAPTFGDCKASSPPVPCSPALQQWQKTSKKVGMGSKTFVMEDSMIQCSKGGIITIKDHTQKSGGGGSGQAQQLSETVPFTG